MNDSMFMRQQRSSAGGTLSPISHSPPFPCYAAARRLDLGKKIRERLRASTVKSTRLNRHFFLFQPLSSYTQTFQLLKLKV